jgi:hypothetical protein
MDKHIIQERLIINSKNRGEKADREKAKAIADAWIGKKK